MSAQRRSQGAEAIQAPVVGARLPVASPPLPGPALPAKPFAPSRRCLVALPTYNEVENLEAVVAAITGHLVCDILVVDDNSPDGTGAIADRLAAERPHVHVLHRARKEGLGPAYVAAFRWGLERDFELLISMDSDFSHPPQSLPALVQTCDGADLVLGSRYVPGGRTEGWHVGRKLLSQGANLFSRVCLGLPVRDLTAGFRCYVGDTLRRLDLDSASASGYAFQVQMAWLVRQSKGIIRETPIEFRERRRGSSKMSGWIAFEALFLIPSLRVRSWFRRRRA